MRGAINAGVAISNGEFIMKIDGHVLFEEGFDLKILETFEDNWIVVPRRFRLDGDTWSIQQDGKPPIDYHYLSHPDDPKNWGGRRMHGKNWEERTVERLNDPRYTIDETMVFQGSCWVMKRSYFEYLELMDWEHYGTFTSESEEICFKSWTTGGKSMVNKNVWYAHLHKGKKYGRGYAMLKQPEERGNEFLNQWLNRKMWHKQIHPLTYLIERFYPVPSWPKERRLWKY